jgi:hypothetical protein
MDILRLRIGKHFCETFLGCDAGMLVAAGWRTEKMLVDLVDQYEACLRHSGGAVRGRQTSRKRQPSRVTALGFCLKDMSTFGRRVID